MSSCLSPRAYRTVPFLWRWSKLGWTSLGVSMVKCLPAQHPEAAPAADCSSICSLYLFRGFFFFIPSSPYLECYPGKLLCQVLSSLVFVPPWLWEFPKCLDTWMWKDGSLGDVPSHPWEDVDGYLGTCLASSSCCSPSSATSPSVWFLPGSSLSAFNPGTKSHFLLCACFTPPFPQPEVRRPCRQMRAAFGAWAALAAFPSFPTCHPQALLHFCSPENLLVLFREEWSWTILYIIKIGAKLFLRDPSSPHFFFSSSCLFFTQSNTE